MPLKCQEQFTHKHSKTCQKASVLTVTYIQEYGHKQMSKCFTVCMVFVVDFLNAENKITLIQRQPHIH